MTSLLGNVRLATAALVTALVTVALTGCGGHKSSVYSLSATQSCLEKAGLQTAVVTDTYLPASGGDLRVRLKNGKKALLDPQQLKGGTPPNEYIFLIFAKSPAAALGTENKAVTLAYQTLRVRGMLITRAAVRADVGLAKNVFFYSTTGGVTAGDRKVFLPCLR